MTACKPERWLDSGASDADANETVLPIVMLGQSQGMHWPISKAMIFREIRFDCMSQTEGSYTPDAQSGSTPQSNTHPQQCYIQITAEAFFQECHRLPGFIMGGCVNPFFMKH